jgi:ubiquinone/menaquinone biosynthesis C-methylase UbiE
LVSYIPDPCSSALDVGCGVGRFSRLLARHSNQVIAVDLSPGMVEVARETSKGYSNIDFQVADIREYPLPDETFDYITSIATLHHLPMEATLIRLKRSLKIGGILAVLDLYETSGIADLIQSIAAVPCSLLLKLIKTGRLRESRQVQKAWSIHRQNDSYPTLAAVRQICHKVLPGARVRKHFFWRFSIIWKKE